jgi:hypothetical protein
MFMWAHRIESRDRFWKTVLAFSGGVASILLYAWLRQPLLNIGLHAMIGSTLVYLGLLYRSDFKTNNIHVKSLHNRP